jgi:dipeptidyl aminopeptidase/acylaminoacyl peptidase
VKIKLLLTAVLVAGSIQAFADYKGLGTESVSPEILKKYAPPALDPVMANKLKKMFDVTSPGMGMLSPDKKTMYFSWRVTGISQVWKIDGPKSFPVQLTSGQDAVNIVAMAPNGKYLIISKDLNGQENPGLFKIDLKTGLIDELYRKPKVQAGLAFLTDDSSTMYFSANDKSPDSYSVYKMNLADKKIETVFDGSGGIWFVADYRDDGKQLLLTKYLGAKQNEYYDYDVASKKLTPVIGQGEKEEYDVSYAPKAGEYLVLSNKTTDFKVLYLMSGGKLKKISKNLNYEIAGFGIDHPRKRIIYTINRDGYTDFLVMDARTLKPLPTPKIPLGKLKADHIFTGSTTRDGKVTMLGIVTSQYPRLSYSYNWATGKTTQWTLPSAPEVDLTKFAVSELMSYETRDHVKIPMFVRFPENCKLNAKNRPNCPVVVHFHGGPEGQSMPGFSTMAQAFVDEGFIFVEPNVRGSDGYGKKWIDIDNGPKRENVITDIEDASVWIKSNWKTADGQPPKIGVMGWSYGGYSTLMAMTRFAGAYDAGVALVGMSNLVSFLMNTAPYRRILRISEYGDPEKDKESLLKLSPITYVNQVKSPLMIVQGANDPRVPVGEALQIHDTLSKNKVESQLIIFADEGHGSAKKDNQVLEVGYTIEFFKKYLKDKDPTVGAN